jgi:hypothetical protein
MALTETQICNMALSRLGIKQYIASRSAGGVEADACDLYYDTTRDKLLESFDWPFARKRVTLSETLNTAPDEWDYEYTYPSGCLRPIMIPDGQVTSVKHDTVSQRGDKIPFEINNVSDVRVIHCDVEEAELIYIAQITDTTLFSEHFGHAFGWALAEELSWVLPVKQSLAERAITQAAKTKQDAIAHMLNSQQAGTQPDSVLISGRE